MPALVVPDPPHADTSTDYDGPSVKDMIASHNLVDEIIGRHNDACPILDPSELILLRSYVYHPAERQEILRNNDMADIETDQSGNRAQAYHGSLVGFTMAREYYNEADLMKLKQWFGEGHADERMRKGGWNGP